jgi:hypothetical protein
VVRNVYTFNLQPSRVQALVDGLRSVYEQVRQELLAFADFLEHLARADEEDSGQ